MNVVCDTLQILYGEIEPPRGDWCPRFPRALVAGVPSASVDLAGPGDVHYRDLVAFTADPRGVRLEVAPAYGVPAFEVLVTNVRELLAMAPSLVAAVRGVVDGRERSRAVASAPEAGCT